MSEDNNINDCLDYEVQCLTSQSSTTENPIESFSPVPIAPIFDKQTQSIKNGDFSAPSRSPSPYYRPWSPYTIVLDVQETDIEIPDDVLQKHFLPFDEEINEESANFVSMNRYDTTKNSVFEPTSTGHLLLARIVSDPRETYKGENFLYFTEKPLSCFQSTWDYLHGWQTIYKGLIHPAFSGHSFKGFHFLEECLKVRPENYQLNNKVK